MTRYILLLTALAAIVGCTYTPQTANIDPTVEVAEENIGQGVAVKLRVKDERVNDEIGRRGTGAIRGAAITSERSVAEVFHEKMAEVLTKKGFTIAGQDDNFQTTLDVEIRALEYSTSMGFWTGGEHMNVAVKAIGNNGVDNYEQFYRSEEEKRVMFVSGAKGNEELINAAVAEVLKQFAADGDLFTLLSNPAQ